MTEQNTKPDDVQDTEQEDEQPRYDGPSPLRRFFWYFVVFSISLLATVISWVLVSNFVDFSVPPQVKLFFTVFTTGVLLFAVPSYMVCSYLWNPRPYFVVDIDAHCAYFALYRLSEKAFRELEVIDGEPFPLGPKIISVRRYDMENNVAKGTWRGSLDDIQLLRKLEEVEELKGSLENLAKRGLSYRSKYTKIIYDSVTKITTAFILDFENTVFSNGEAVHEAVRDSIDSNLPDLEPEDDDLDLDDVLEHFDGDRSFDFDDLDGDPFNPPTGNGNTDDELNPRSTRWSK